MQLFLVGIKVRPGANTNDIVYFDIATGGNSIKFGDLGISQGYSECAASSTRAVYAGGAIAVLI